MPCYVRWLIHVAVPLLFFTYMYCSSQVLFECNTEAAEHGGKGQSPLEGKAQGLKCLFAVAFVLNCAK